MAHPMTFPGASAQDVRAPFLWRIMGALIRPWLKIKTEPPRPEQQLAHSDAPVVYLLERYGMSNALILEEACRQHGLPPPLLPMPGGHMRKQRSLLALSRRDGSMLLGR